MRKVFLLLLTAAATFTASGQASYDEISRDPDKTGGLYYLYPVTGKVETTKAPKGYAPFYISHYGRHGSRYLVNDEDYSKPLATFHSADSAASLTPKGREVMHRLETIWDDVKGRSGELTRKGNAQHHDIAQRMYRAYPAVFDKDAVMTARSTTVMRCAHSMAAFCEGLKELNPSLNIPRESGKRYMKYMANVTPEANKFNRWDGPAAKAVAEFDKAMTKPGRMMNELFVDNDFTRSIDAPTLMRQLFLISIDQPNADIDTRLDDIFTTEERFDLWRAFNFRYYNHMSNPTSANGAILNNARPLLTNILESAEAMIASGKHGADLRFGHDSCIVPLVGLMKVDGCYGSTDDPYKLHEVYADFKISPMAANLQLIFFKNKKDDIIVKILLNEQEVSIPVSTDIAPFYHWNDVRQYFNDILTD